MPVLVPNLAGSKCPQWEAPIGTFGDHVLSCNRTGSLLSHPRMPPQKSDLKWDCMRFRGRLPRFLSTVRPLAQTQRPAMGLAMADVADADSGEAPETPNPCSQEPVAASPPGPPPGSPVEQLSSDPSYSVFQPYSGLVAKSSCKPWNSVKPRPKMDSSTSK